MSPDQNNKDTFVIHIRGALTDHQLSGKLKRDCRCRFKERYARELSEHDAVVSDVPDVGSSRALDDHHFPFVGNGMIGSSILPPHHSSLYIYHKPVDQPKTKLIRCPNLF